MMMRVLVLAAGLGAAGFMGQKLHKAAQVRGWVPGASVARRAVAQKGWDSARRLRDDDSCWVSFSAAASTSWADRHRLTPESWHRLNVGDVVEVVRVPGDGETYLRDDIQFEDGNVALDAVMLAAALAAAVWATCGLLGKAGRGDEDAPDDKGRAVHPHTIRA
ncbi:MAG: hypothetical protein ACRC33_16295 [Gemmataceae bacterium]